MKKIKIMFYFVSSKLSPLGGYYIQIIMAKAVVLVLLLRGFKNVNYRNSSYFKRAILGLSDIDITAVVESDDEAFCLVETQRKMKKFFPMWCETNIYNSKDLDLVCRIANPLEMQRDPLFNFSGNVSLAQKFVFFFKMFKSDIKNLREIPFARVEKWKFHFAQLGLKFPEVFSVDSLLNSFLASFVSMKLDEKEIWRWVSFLERKNKSDCEINDFVTSDETGSIVMLVDYPTWLGGNFSEFEQTSMSKVDKNQLNILEVEILKEQIKWELMGLYTQKFYLKKWVGENNIKSHLAKIHTSTKVLNINDESIANGLSELF